MSPYRAHNWVVEFQYHNRVHRDTRICPYNVFNVLCYIPCIQFLTFASYQSASSPSLPSFSSAVTTTIALAPARSVPSFSHHLLETQAPAPSSLRGPESSASQCYEQPYSASLRHKLSYPQNPPPPFLSPAVGNPTPPPPYRRFVCLPLST